MIEHNGYVQYGCGLVAPPTWTNFDASPTLWLQRLPGIGPLLTRGGPQFPAEVHYGDITQGVPIAPASCTAIYCSHVLEHLALADLRSALRHTYSHLKLGGVFRCVLPDLEVLARQYLASTADQPAVEFLEATEIGCRQRPRTLGAQVRDWLGNSRHLWMWDYRSLAYELEQVGFVAIRRASFGDADDPCFQDVEQVSRWQDSLGIEARRA